MRERVGSTQGAIRWEWRALLLDRVLLSLFALSMPVLAMLILEGRGRAPRWTAVLTATLFLGFGVLYALRARISYRVRAVGLIVILVTLGTFGAWAVGFAPGLPLVFAIAGMIAALCHGPLASAVVFAHTVACVWAINTATTLFGYEPPLKEQVFSSHAFAWIRMSLSFTVLCAVVIGIAAYAASLAQRSLGALGASVDQLRQEIELRKQAEAQRERAAAELLKRQKFEVAAKFSARVAHDFNNALMVVLTSTDRLQRLLSRDPLLTSELAAIERSAKSAADVSRALLVHSRDVPATLRSVRLDRFLLEAAGMMERALPANIGLQIDARDVPPVRADPRRLDQALLNLVFNARDAMPAGGSLFARTFSSGSGSASALQIRDTGQGMDANTQARIFEPFFTTKPERGTGLGLSSVQAIVSEVGGTVEVESEPGRGSTFTLWFPHSKATPDA